MVGAGLIFVFVGVLWQVERAQSLITLITLTPNPSECRPFCTFILWK